MFFGSYGLHFCFSIYWLLQLLIIISWQWIKQLIRSQIRSRSIEEKIAIVK